MLSDSQIRADIIFCRLRNQMFRLEVRTTLRFQTVVVNLTQDRSIIFYKGMTVSQTGIIDKGGISLNN